MRKIPLVFTALCLVLLCFGAAANASAAALKTYKNSIGMEFMLIPAGSFMMGIDPNFEEGGSDETPQHSVTISKPFYLGKYEVTQAEWEAVMGGNPSKFKRRTHPVEQVSWDDAQEFIRRLNQKEGHKRYRLPTEAEWEYATRAGTGSAYSFGDNWKELSTYAWYGEEYSSSSTHPVGQKRPNPWGLYDVHGNVDEWVQDWYGEKYYANSPGTDPKGPANGSGRVLRGGGWNGYTEFCRSGLRSYDTPSYRHYSIGFRLVLSPE